MKTVYKSIMRKKILIFLALILDIMIVRTLVIFITNHSGRPIKFQWPTIGN